MTVTIRDVSLAHYYRRKIPQRLSYSSAVPFYPGDRIKAETVILRCPAPYLRHMQHLIVHCVIDRSDMGTDTSKLNKLDVKDATPSIQDVLKVRERLPSLKCCEINVYFTVRHVYGLNYSLLWIDDCLKPLLILCENDTTVRVTIPVLDSYNTDDPTRQIMRVWHAKPSGPDGRDWLHQGHALGITDLDGTWKCYVCFRDNQHRHRYHRKGMGWTSQTNGASYQTFSSRHFDEATGTTTANIQHHVVPPAPIFSPVLSLLPPAYYFTGQSFNRPISDQPRYDQNPWFPSGAFNYGYPLRLLNDGAQPHHNGEETSNQLVLHQPHRSRRFQQMRS